MDTYYKFTVSVKQGTVRFLARYVHCTIIVQRVHEKPFNANPNPKYENGTWHLVTFEELMVSESIVRCLPTIERQILH